ncbi:hypothetical protein F4559_003560 [Saccharothrix violaceirubra]|uniref:Uncharacterized protein n=1 Tax=Saccharothrix violaceirubra TaxID=413306 RepID=A0A7W7T467_9PSEU|nr:hypothetical protein [Saccharothrix violaceirubra]
MRAVLVVAGLVGAVVALIRRRPRVAPGYTAIPRTHFLLRVPTGMAVDPALPGLVRPGAGTSVLVAVNPLTPDADAEEILTDLATGFTGVRAAAQGLELDRPQRLEVAGFPAVATTGIQRVGDARVRKAVVALITDDEFVMLTATLADDDPLSTPEALAVLTAARRGATRAPGDLGFDVTPAPGYHRSSHPGSALLLTLGPETGDDVPVFVVAASVDDVATPDEDRRDAALGRFAALPSTPTVDDAAAVEIAGLPGYEITGRGTGRWEAVYCTVLFRPAGYLVLSGWYDPLVHDDQHPAFRAMARSLVLTR